MLTAHRAVTAGNPTRLRAGKAISAGTQICLSVAQRDLSSVGGIKGDDTQEKSLP